MQHFLGFAFHPAQVQKATLQEIKRNVQEEETWGIVAKRHRPHQKEGLTRQETKQTAKERIQASKEEREWEVIAASDYAEEEEKKAEPEIELEQDRVIDTSQQIDDTFTMSVTSDEEVESTEEDEEDTVISENAEEADSIAYWDAHTKKTTQRLLPQNIEKIREPQTTHERKTKKNKERNKQAKQAKKLPPTLAEMGVACRINKKLYVAIDDEGTFGLVDSGVVRTGTRELVMHVKRGKNKLYEVTPKVGDVMHVKSLIDTRVHRGLDVIFTTQHKYYPPGREVTTYTIGVPEAQWQEIRRPQRN